MNAMSASERERHQAVVRQLFGSIGEIRELDNGYEFRLSAESQPLLTAAEFISRERLCCLFFRFTLDADRDATWLRLTGPGGIKPFIIEEFGLGEKIGLSAGARV